MSQQIQTARVQRPSSRSVESTSSEFFTPPAPPPIDARWDHAFMRVESYLRAHHIQSRSLLTRLTTEIVAEARALVPLSPDQLPVETAMRVAQTRVGEWLQRSIGEGTWSDDRFRGRGRLALLMSGVPDRCPEYFLADERLPTAEAQRMVRAQLQPGPELRPVGMPPATVEFPFTEMAEEKWITFSRSAFTRAAASWGFFIGFLAVAWIVTR